MLERITSRKNALVGLGIVLAMAIAFETMQQMYYIKRYDIAQGVTFWELLKAQASRWIIWAALGILLQRYCMRQHKARSSALKYYTILTGVILGLVILNVIFISGLQMVLNGDTLWTLLFFTEYVPFYIFQKAPIYTLGYIAIATILELYYKKEQLEVEMVEFKDIQVRYDQLEQKLNKIPKDKLRVLTIKIGNKRRIIAVDQIRWVESDDYCVKVHTMNNESLTMRISMKAINEMLGMHFMRVHRKAIVNMREVISLKLSNPPAIVLSNQLEIPVSKGQLKAVKSFLS